MLLQENHCIEHGTMYKIKRVCNNSCEVIKFWQFSGCQEATLYTV